MDDLRSHSEEEWLDDSGAPDRNRRRSWAARARDWKQVLLFLLVLVGIGVGVYYAGGPPSHHYRPMTPAVRQLAARFTTTLLVRGDCAAATALSWKYAFDPSPPPPRTHNPQRCFRYLRYNLGHHSWYLIRDSGAVSRHCSIEDQPPDRHDDDCLTYQLMARSRDPNSGKPYFTVGYLVLRASPLKNHIWQIDEVAALEEPGLCLGECQQMWSRRIRRA